ncbi:MAG: Bis(5'-adenosyl)-triphosphatase [candidate division TM6 bacterium GW2011_GWE2_41_16]|nr:MAG: Bis(5'-adenosyl)-triphosphatase [candidate division TM6 bacterium GW2011_GWE2_41_16]
MPWRSKYYDKKAIAESTQIYTHTHEKSAEKQDFSKNGCSVPDSRGYTNKIEGCPFCNMFEQSNDRENFILKRYEHCAVLLNLHPYNTGHLLVVPYMHTGDLDALGIPARAEMFKLVNSMTKILYTTLNCDGINIGINLGDGAAGGSIPDHVHVHIVPRYKGDTNFLPITSNTRLITRDLNDVYDQLVKVL